MKNVKQTLHRLLTFSGHGVVSEKKPLSRQDVLRLLAANKLSAAQAKAVLEKRFREND